MARAQRRAEARLERRLKAYKETIARSKTEVHRLSFHQPGSLRKKGK
jgi:hypothetical protein